MSSKVRVRPQAEALRLVRVQRLRRQLQPVLLHEGVQEHLRAAHGPGRGKEGQVRKFTYVSGVRFPKTVGKILCLC